MPTWTVFLFFAVAMLASLAAVGFGVWVMISSRPSSPAEEIDVQVPQWGIKVVARMSGGALLVLAGLFSAYKLTVEYPKAWIAVAIVLAGAGGGAGAKKQKKRSGKKKPPPKRQPPPKRHPPPKKGPPKKPEQYT